MNLLRCSQSVRAAFRLPARTVSGGLPRCRPFSTTGRNLQDAGGVQGLPGTPRRFVVDVISDIRCPWCYVGHKRLQDAVRFARGAAQQEQQPGAAAPLEVDVRWHPFLLDSSLGFTGIDKREYYLSKFGEVAMEEYAPEIRASFAEAGLCAYREDGTVSSSLHSHRLMAVAEREGKHHEMAGALFEAYFCHGQNIADVSVLVAAAEKAGLEGSDVRKFLDSDELVAETKESARDAEALKLSIPHFTVSELVYTGSDGAKGSGGPRDWEKRLVAELEGVPDRSVFIQALGAEADVAAPVLADGRDSGHAGSAVGGSCGSASIASSGSASGRILRRDALADGWAQASVLPEMLGAHAFPADLPFCPAHFERLDETDDADFCEHCLSLTFHCLSFHCLSLTFHCLSLTFHCLS